MTFSKKVSPQALFALKEAMTSVYWTKKDLRKFVEYTIENQAILATIDWSENTKYQSVSELVDRMNRKPEIFKDDLLRLFKATADFEDFSHLQRWEEGEQKVQKASLAVQKLRKMAKGYFDKVEEKESIKIRQQKALEKLESKRSYAEKLRMLRKQFLKIATNSDMQKRGLQLEEFLNELFLFFDLNPTRSFRIVGEQIDGAFTFDNNDYLLEAKWQKKPIYPSDLYAFGGKISGKLKNTLGLFISLGPFADSCTEVANPMTQSMILMDGEDLMNVIDGRISLDESIFRKRRCASETGLIYYKPSI